MDGAELTIFSLDNNFFSLKPAKWGWILNKVQSWIKLSFKLFNEINKKFQLFSVSNELMPYEEFILKISVSTRWMCRIDWDPDVRLAEVSQCLTLELFLKALSRKIPANVRNESDPVINSIFPLNYELHDTIMWKVVGWGKKNNEKSDIHFFGPVRASSPPSPDT